MTTRAVQRLFIALGLTSGASTLTFAALALWLTRQPHRYDIFGDTE
jgi:hypothetical protein